MIIITIDKTVNVIRKYGEVFNLDNSSFLLDVYQLGDKLTYDGSGSLAGTYKVTYTSSDFVIGTISSYQGSCSVGNVVTVLNPDVINTSVSFLVTGKDLQGVPFNRTYNVTYVTLSDGESITFTTVNKGSLSTFPANPEEGWVFYHTTAKSSLIYISGEWLLLSSSGSNGTDGSGFNIKGTYANLASVPDPTVGDVVKVGTDTYMYGATGWIKIASEGTQGPQGPSGADGASLFTVYNSASIDNPPPTPTGNGIGDGWSYASNSGSNWMSQKTSNSLNTGIWNDPILIAGRDGESIAGTDGKRGNLWLSESVDEATMLLLSDEDPLVSDPAWVTTAGAVVVGQNLTPQNGDIVTLTYQNLALDAPVDSGWSEARRYEEDTNTWVDAGMFVSGDLLVEGTTWANGAIRSSNFQWNLGLEPEGFLLSGNGIEDPNNPTNMYNIAAGSIYGSYIEGSTMKASYIEGSIIHATNTGTAGNVIMTSNGLYGYDNNSRNSFELNTSGLFSVGDTNRTVINRLPAKWSIFDEYLSVANGDMWANNPAVDAYVVSSDTTLPGVSSDGSIKSVLRITNSDPVGVTDAYVYLGKDNTYYNIPVIENTNYVISFYVLRELGPINNGQVYIRRNGDSSTIGQTVAMPSNGVWYRRHFAFNSLTANKILIRFDVDSNSSILIDRVMLEQTNSTTPSNFEHPNSGYLKWDNDKLTLLGGLQTHTEGERLAIGNDTNSLTYYNSNGSEVVSIGDSKLIDNPDLGASRSAYIYSKNTRNDEYSLYCESPRISGYFYSNLRNITSGYGGINLYVHSRLNHIWPGALSVGIYSLLEVDSLQPSMKIGVDSTIKSTNGLVNLHNAFAVYGSITNTGAGGTHAAVFGVLDPTVEAGASAFDRIALRGEAYCQGSSIGVYGSGNTYDFYAGGSGTNYAPFTGSHEAIVPEGSNYQIGDIIVDLDLVSTRGISNTVFTARLSDSSLDRAIGVVASEEMHYNPNALGDGFKAAEKGEEELTVDLLPEGTNCIAFNALGEGQINVCGEGGNLSNGDLIMCSNMPGKGMRQNKTDGTPDDIIRNITVAKVRGNWTFDNPQEVKQVACIYLCG